MSIALTLSQAIVGLTEGHVIWCQPVDYRGWWVALGRNGVLYEHGPGNTWFRSKKGVSTILGAAWHLRPPEDPTAEAPTFNHAHYESEAFLAHEARRRAMSFDDLDRRLAGIEGALRQLGDAIVKAGRPGPGDG